MNKLTLIVIMVLGSGLVACAEGKNVYHKVDEAIKHPDKVTHLDLSGQGLREIPSEIAMLSKIESLNLSDNRIKEVPDFLTRLVKLKTLDLRGNAIAEESRAGISKRLDKVVIHFTFLDWFTWLTGLLAGYAWGLPTVIILVGTGIYLTIRMGFVQGRGFRHSIELIQGKHDQKDDPGEVSHFQALTTALSATVGTGNIAGVATAIAMGGPGAVFWMWITALVGMASKYTSCTLSLKYRELHPDGKVSGGPMYTLKHGLNMPKLAAVFAFFTLIASFGIGNMVQSNSVVDGLKVAIPSLNKPEMAGYEYYTGVILALLVGMVILGGVRRIARVAAIVVPFMAAVYCGAALLILFFHIEKIPSAFATILNLALNPWAIGGGMMGEAIRYGVSRGVFSNEAGLGSAPMAHAAAKTKEPVREGLVAMLEPFIDTILICTMTALVIVITGSWGEGRPDGLTSSGLSAYAFQSGFGSIFGEELKYIGAWVVSFGLVFFAYSTIISWSYYGDRSAEFLFGEKAVLPYRIIYTMLVVVGAAIPIKLVWNLADTANILMAAPNLLSIILLAGMVKSMTNKYFSQKKNIPPPK
ncbi:MAG: amino acid carrier protein [Spirochaetota bacterium]|nr:amino acid carrier protein [Spirochaetota bacterium]